MPGGTAEARDLHTMKSRTSKRTSDRKWPGLILAVGRSRQAADGRETGRANRFCCGSPARAACLRSGYLQAKLAAMTSSIDSNPEDEYADDEYADHDVEDREQPSTPADIPDDEPEEDVLEQRQEVPYREDDR